jgi:hypothetical protein
MVRLAKTGRNEMKIELDVVETCDCDLVPEGRFGVLCSSGNYLGDFATRGQAQRFIKEELEGIARGDSK